jgi:hypothetical protein
MVLEKELATYKKELPVLLKDAGKYVLIQGDKVAGVYTSQEDALKIGYEKFQLTPFLIKRIEQTERVFFFSNGGVEPAVLHTPARP